MSDKHQEQLYDWAKSDQLRTETLIVLIIGCILIAGTVAIVAICAFAT